MDEEPRTYAAGAHPDTAENMYGPRQMFGMVPPPPSAWPNVNACIDRSTAAQMMGQAAGEPAPSAPQPPPPPPQTNQKVDQMERLINFMIERQQAAEAQMNLIVGHLQPKTAAVGFHVPESTANG
eukprot:5913739-Pyramimonas_sp.AAC.1